MSEVDKSANDPAHRISLREGRCHCGTVRFTAKLPAVLKAGRCTCSICAMKGSVMVGVALDGLTITSGEDHLTCYRFNTGAAKHFFCSTCGIHCFHQRRSAPDQYAINAACLEGVSPFDFAEIVVTDGINHPNDNAGNWRIAGILRFNPRRS